MKKHALLMGPGQCSHLSHLGYAEQDATVFAETLRERYGFGEDEITLMTCNEKGEFNASRNNIKAKIEEIGEKKGFDLLLVGFWGHGKVLSSPSGSYERYLCAHDTYGSNLEDTGIPLGFLLQHLKKAGAMDTCLILDMCQAIADDRYGDAGLTEGDCARFSQGVRDIQVAERRENDQGRNPTTAILSSCSFKQKAYEWHDRKHGIFTYYLLDEMQRSGRLTDWANYVSKYVPPTAREVAGARQQPFLTIEGSGDILFPMIAPTKTEPEVLPVESQRKAEQIVEEEKRKTERITEEAKRKAAEIYAEVKPLPPKPKSAVSRRKWMLATGGLLLGGFGWVCWPRSTTFSPKADLTAIAEEVRQWQEAVRILDQPDDRIKSGDRVVLPINGVEYPFRWCPAGTFTMGSPESEEGQYDGETQHQVTLSRGFWMLETPVTQAMWDSVMDNNPSDLKGVMLPVGRVTWEDCQEYITKLNAHLAGTPGVHLAGTPGSGYRFSLPTEAQWEYACRAGTMTATYAGEMKILGANNAPILDAIAWYGGNSSVGYTGSKGYDTKDWPDKQYPGGMAGTRDVYGKTPNAWGLYDMHGNVWEWCSDWYGTYPGGAVTDPTGASSGSERVLRGGSWFSCARDCRSANRGFNKPSVRGSNFGVRLSLVRVE